MIRDICGACETPAKANVYWIMSPEGLALRCVPPWRVRNAALSLLSIGTLVEVPSIVLLCSDVCEERYGRRVGFVPTSAA